MASSFLREVDIVRFALVYVVCQGEENRDQEKDDPATEINQKLCPVQEKHQVEKP
jgi:hypothetical protein